MTKEYHLFLSHNSKDKPIVRDIHNRLEAKNIRPWFDEKDLLAGDTFVSELENALLNSYGMAVFVGPKGLSKWHEKERIIAEQLHSADAAFRVIPILLPGSSKEQMPPFLKSRTFCDFREWSRLIEAEKEELIQQKLLPAIPARVSGSGKKGLPPKRKLICYRLDRNDQIAELREMVKNRGNQQGKKQSLPEGVHVCVLHGDERECHWEFLKCLENHYWRYEIDPYNEEYSDPKLIELKWPGSWRKFNQISDYFVECLSNVAKKTKSRDFEEVSAKLNEQTVQQPVIVYINFTSDTPDHQLADKMKHFIDFWRRWPSRSPRFPLVACPLVIYWHKIPEKKTKSRFFGWMPGRRPDPETGNTRIRKMLKDRTLGNHVLTELAGVMRQDVLYWSREQDVRPICERFGWDIIDVIGDIFRCGEYKTDGDSMHMSEMARALADRYRLYK